MNIGPLGGGFSPVPSYGSKGGSKEEGQRIDDSSTTPPRADEAGLADAPTDTDMAQRAFRTAVDRELVGLVRNLIERRRMRGGDASASNIRVSMDVSVRRDANGQVSVTFNQLELPEEITRTRVESILRRLASSGQSALCLAQTVDFTVRR